MKIFRFLLPLFAATLPVAAQYRTESFAVKAGWNAIYLNVDPGSQTFEEIFQGSPDVLQVWQWSPSQVDPSLNGGDPENPLNEWRVWRRDDPEGTVITTAIPNNAYLVELDGAASDQTISFKGKVVEPKVLFRTDGLNLVGFPITSGAPKQLNRYLAGAGLFDNNTNAFRYVGGPLAQNSNPLDQPARFIDARRGEAFWIRSNQFTDFYGPLNVNVALDDGLNFGSGGDLKRLVVTNQTDVEITATLTLEASESAPGGVGALAQPGLTVQERDETTGGFTYRPFGASETIVLPPKAKRGITLAINRASLTGPVGTQFASLLKVVDQQENSSTYTEIYLPVTAEQGGLSGLWLGEAHISQVQNRLQKFQRDAEGNLELDEDGDAIPEGEQQAGLAGTAQTFKMRLLVHLDDAGQATLLSQAFVGLDGTGAPIVSTTESALDAAQLDSASRLTTSHFPLDMAETLSGAFAPGGQLTATVVLGANHKSNPFLHSYHPDHDNKDARFSSTPLPDGVESHRIERAVTLSFDATDTVGIGPSWGGSVLTGTFSEVISGLHKQSLQTSGAMSFSKVTDISTFVR